MINYISFSNFSKNISSFIAREVKNWKRELKNMKNRGKEHCKNVTHCVFEKKRIYVCLIYDNLPLYVVVYTCIFKARRIKVSLLFSPRIAIKLCKKNIIEKHLFAHWNKIYFCCIRYKQVTCRIHVEW